MQKQQAVYLNGHQRTIVDAALKEVASFRDYNVRALNVRSNHVHAVVSKAVRPEKIVNDFKSYATRRLRLERCIDLGSKIWSRGASTRYLWKPRDVEAAVDYVLYSQGDIPWETVSILPGGSTL